MTTIFLKAFGVLPEGISRKVMFRMIGRSHNKATQATFDLVFMCAARGYDLYVNHAVTLATYKNYWKEIVEDRNVLSKTINCYNKSGLTPLHVAAQNHQINMIGTLLRHGASLAVSTKSSSKHTAHLAASKGHVEVLETLFSTHGVDVNVVDGENSSLLFTAATAGNEEVVDCLLSHNADTSIVTESSKTPLYGAAEGGHTYIVQRLLEVGSDVNHACSTGKSALYVAAEGGFDQIVALLLQHGADASHETFRQKTALYAACEHGHVEVVKQLLAFSRVEDLFKVTVYGTTPVYIASKQHTEVVKLLLAFLILAKGRKQLGVPISVLNTFWVSPQIAKLKPPMFVEDLDVFYREADTPHVTYARQSAAWPEESNASPGVASSPAASGVASPQDVVSPGSPASPTFQSRSERRNRRNTFAPSSAGRRSRSPTALDLLRSQNNGSARGHSSRARSPSSLHASSPNSPYSPSAARSTAEAQKRKNKTVNSVVLSQIRRRTLPLTPSSRNSSSSVCTGQTRSQNKRLEAARPNPIVSVNTAESEEKKEVSKPSSVYTDEGEIDGIGGEMKKGENDTPLSRADMRRIRMHRFSNESTTTRDESITAVPSSEGDGRCDSDSVEKQVTPTTNLTSSESTPKGTSSDEDKSSFLSKRGSTMNRKRSSSRRSSLVDRTSAKGQAPSLESLRAQISNNLKSIDKLKEREEKEGNSDKAGGKKKPKQNKRQTAPPVTTSSSPIVGPVSSTTAVIDSEEGATHRSNNNVSSPKAGTQVQVRTSSVRNLTRLMEPTQSSASKKRDTAEKESRRRSLKERAVMERKIHRLPEEPCSPLKDRGDGPRVSRKAKSPPAKSSSSGKNNQQQSLSGRSKDKKKKSENSEEGKPKRVPASTGSRSSPKTNPISRTLNPLQATPSNPSYGSNLEGKFDEFVDGGGSRAEVHSAMSVRQAENHSLPPPAITIPGYDLVTNKANSTALASPHRRHASLVLSSPRSGESVWDSRPSGNNARLGSSVIKSVLESSRKFILRQDLERQGKRTKIDNFSSHSHFDLLQAGIPVSMSNQSKNSSSASGSSSERQSNRRKTKVERLFQVYGAVPLRKKKHPLSSGRTRKSSAGSKTTARSFESTELESTSPVQVPSPPKSAKRTTSAHRDSMEKRLTAASKGSRTIEGETKAGGERVE